MNTIFNFLRGIFIFRKKISFGQYVKYMFFFNKNTNEHEKYHKLNLKEYQNPICFRPGTSDMLVIRDFFLKIDYVDTMPEALHIIDAGANIGAATILFKKRYPLSKIIAIEPDENNCHLFRKNTSHLENVILLKGGLTSMHNKFLLISNPNDSPYAYRLKYAKEGIPSYSINGLMKSMGWNIIDIVKIDIEGGEKDLFDRNTEWLGVTKQIIIELHDDMIEGCSVSLIKALQEYHYNISFSGENLILTNSKLCEV